LISIDTLRADYLGCYGAKHSASANIDLLAENGTRFSQISAPTPLTLPSHVSLLTSLHPFAHGIRDNGQILGSDLPSLPGVLKSNGYRTAAFVGSYVLDQRFGLNRGFAVYDSPFDLHRRAAVASRDSKRFGEEVVRSAQDWIDKNSDAPFFVFLHLYDMHKPYDLPLKTATRLKGTGYVRQLRYVDEVLGRFWVYLREHQLLDKALLVFTSDHGEGLGDHGESTHGYYIYQSTVRVPLILRWPSGSKPLPGNVDEPASLIDAAPTILDFVGIGPPAEFQGKSLLRETVRGSTAANREVYSESLFAQNHFGCSALRSLRLGPVKYIDAPIPELYDLASDPNEARNLYSQNKRQAQSLRDRLLALPSSVQSERTAKLTTANNGAAPLLRSLGYVGGRPTVNRATPAVDPKTRIKEAETFHYATALAASGQPAEANRLFEGLKEALPEVAAVYNGLGLGQQKMGKHAEAVASFREVLKQDPSHAEAHYNLAVSLLALRQPEQAVQELNLALEFDPGYSLAHYLMGSFWMQRKDYGQARSSFNQMLRLTQDDYAAHYHLGLLSALQGKLEEGRVHLQHAVRIDPESAEAYNALGSVYLRLENLDGATQAYLDAIRLEPKSAWAHYNLGLVYRKRGMREEARKQFGQALQADPQFSEARKALNEFGPAAR